MDHLGAQHAALLENLGLVGGQGVRLAGRPAVVLLLLAAGEFHDLLGDADAAPVVAAHGAEVGVHVEVLVVEGAGGVGVSRRKDITRRSNAVGAGRAARCIPQLAQRDRRGSCGNRYGVWPDGKDRPRDNKLASADHSPVTPDADS